MLESTSAFFSRHRRQSFVGSSILALLANAFTYFLVALPLIAMVSDCQPCGKTREPACEDGVKEDTILYAMMALCVLITQILSKTLYNRTAIFGQLVSSYFMFCGFALGYGSMGAAMMRLDLRNFEEYCLEQPSDREMAHDVVVLSLFLNTIGLIIGESCSGCDFDYGGSSNNHRLR